MRLKYQTAVATLVQFIVLGLLNIANGIESVVTTCRHDQPNCISNLLTSSIFYILLVGWLGIIIALGYFAQERRSKRLAQLLIAAEGATMLVALFNIKLGLKHPSSVLSTITSYTDVILALWVITLAYRLMRSGGGRIIAQRSRRRKPPTS